MTRFALQEELLFSNPTPRLAVSIAADESPSMTGEPIAELNEGIGLFYREVQQDEIARNAVELSVISFAMNAAKERDFEPIMEATPPLLSIRDGGTALGHGVEMALDLLDNRKKQYQDNGLEYYQPWLVLITDGQPTDDHHLVVAPRIARLVETRKLSVFAIGVGSHADMQALALMSPKRPPVRLKELKFREFFEFLSRSVSQVSCSQPSDTIKIDTTGMAAWGEV